MSEKPAAAAARGPEMRADNSAARVALVRAWDTTLPPEERICDDPLAVHLVPEFMRFMITTEQGRAFFLSGLNSMLTGFLGYVPLRTRVMDECLLSSLQQGLEQLVLLGAGLDSRAYRMEGLGERARVFEVDQADPQEVKKARLVETLGALPPHVSFVPIDFESDSLAQRLAEAGFSGQKQTLFIWEGVTFFLEAEAVDQTLAFVASGSRPGSSIIFDYTLPGVIDGTHPDPDALVILSHAAELGEPYKFGIDPGRIDQFLTQRGLELVENLSIEQCKQKYHGPAQADRPVAAYYNIAHARVTG